MKYRCVCGNGAAHGRGRAADARTRSAHRTGRTARSRAWLPHAGSLCTPPVRGSPPHLYAPCWAPSLARSVEVSLFAPSVRPASLRTRSLASARGDVPCAGVQPGVHIVSRARALHGRPPASRAAPGRRCLRLPCAKGPADRAGPPPPTARWGGTGPASGQLLVVEPPPAARPPPSARRPPWCAARAVCVRRARTTRCRC